jgi:hypothetical protein
MKLEKLEIEGLRKIIRYSKRIQFMARISKKDLH